MLKSLAGGRSGRQKYAVPDEVIEGSVVRIAGFALRFIVELVWELFLVRVGRLVVYLLTFGRVDTDQSLPLGAQWLNGVIGFLAIGGLASAGWFLFS